MKLGGPNSGFSALNFINRFVMLASVDLGKYVKRYYSSGASVDWVKYVKRLLLFRWYVIFNGKSANL